MSNMEYMALKEKLDTQLVKTIGISDWFDKGEKMIIDSNHPDFGKMELVDAHEAKIKLLVKSFNTETEEAEIYIPVEPQLNQEPELQASVARTPKEPTEGNGWKCEIITAKVKIPGAKLQIRKKDNV